VGSRAVLDAVVKRNIPSPIRNRTLEPRSSIEVEMHYGHAMGTTNTGFPTGLVPCWNTNFVETLSELIITMCSFPFLYKNKMFMCEIYM
jgi:hypothetical protein